MPPSPELSGELVFVTSNAGKAKEASFFLGRLVTARPGDIREIQSLSFEEVVRAKALDAAHGFRCPVIVDDSGLSLAAWNGYPGPFTRWALDTMGLDTFARMVDLLPDRKADAVAALALASPDDPPERVIVAVGRVPGRIAERPRGTNGFGWDALFVPEGEERTYAEMSADEKNAVSHRARAFEVLRALLQRDGAV